MISWNLDTFIMMEIQTQILRQCIQRISLIEFVDLDSDSNYLSIRSGKFEVVDESIFRHRLEDDSLRDIVAELAPELLPSAIVK